MKLATMDRDQKSVEASLRSAEAQAKEKCQWLHYIEIELAMTKQQVLELKTKLSKAKEAA